MALLLKVLVLVSCFVCCLGREIFSLDPASTAKLNVHGFDIGKIGGITYLEASYKASISVLELEPRLALLHQLPSYSIELFVKTMQDTDIPVISLRSASGDLLAAMWLGSSNIWESSTFTIPWPNDAILSFGAWHYIGLSVDRRNGETTQCIDTDCFRFTFPRTAPSFSVVGTQLTIGNIAGNFFFLGCHTARVILVT
jgi:hypothetical protein